MRNPASAGREELQKRAEDPARRSPACCPGVKAHPVEVGVPAVGEQRLRVRVVRVVALEARVEPLVLVEQPLVVHRLGGAGAGVGLAEGDALGDVAVAVPGDLAALPAVGVELLEPPLALALPPPLLADVVAAAALLPLLPRLAGLPAAAIAVAAGRTGR